MKPEQETMESTKKKEPRRRNVVHRAGRVFKSTLTANKAALQKRGKKLARADVEALFENDAKMHEWMNAMDDDVLMPQVHKIVDEEEPMVLDASPEDDKSAPRFAGRPSDAGSRPEAEAGVGAGDAATEAPISRANQYKLAAKARIVYYECVQKGGYLPNIPANILPYVKAMEGENNEVRCTPAYQYAIISCPTYTTWRRAKCA